MLIVYLEIIFQNHVNGHVGIYGNEEADKLAKAGCSEYHAPVYYKSLCK